MPSKKQRVIDYLSSSNNLNWNADNPERIKLMNLYDKNFLQAELFVKFEQTIHLGDEININRYRKDIYQNIDKFYLDYVKQIEKEKIDTLIEEKSIGSYLKLIALQIENAKEKHKHPRELQELVLIKLAILRDYAKNGCYEYTDSMVAYSPLSERKNGYLNDDEYTKHILEIPLTEDTKKIKTEIGPGINVYTKYESYAENTDIFPLYSPTGVLGVNTILYVIFSGYLPVSFSVNPKPVHINIFEEQSFWTTRHDYGHCFNGILSLKENNPRLFEECRKIYFNLFKERENNLIDDETFKRELLILFIITYDISHLKDKEISMEDIILDRTKSLDQLHLTSTFKNRLKAYKAIDKKDRPVQEKNFLNQELSRMAVIETFGYVKLLQDLGYNFPDNINHKPWKMAESLQKSLLDILNKFTQRHPKLLHSGSRATKNP